MAEDTTLKPKKLLSPQYSEQPPEDDVESQSPTPPAVETVDSGANGHAPTERAPNEDPDEEQDDAKEPEEQDRQDDQVEVELVVKDEDTPSNGQAGGTKEENSQTMSTALQEETRRTRWFAKCQQTNVAHCCIDTWRVVEVKDEKTGQKDAQLEVVLVPEAFRMWFYYGWWIFITTAIVVSIMFADIPYDDNVFIEYFNGLSICIFFDYPPFGYFGALMWMPQIINLLIYEVLDILRVYDCYLDGQVNKGNTKNIKTITKKFFHWYLVSTIFEMLAFIGFIQTMATSPLENWRVHSVPYLIMTYGLWTMAFKRFLYLRATGKLEEAWSTADKCPQLKRYAGWVYVILLWISMFFKTSILWPNFFGLKLWKRPAWMWTDRLLQYSVYVWFFLTLIVPIVIYWVVTDDLETVKCVVNRYHFKNQDEEEITEPKRIRVKSHDMDAEE